MTGPAVYGLELALATTGAATGLFEPDEEDPLEPDDPVDPWTAWEGVTDPALPACTACPPVGKGYEPVVYTGGEVAAAGTAVDAATGLCVHDGTAVAVPSDPT